MDIQSYNLLQDDAGNEKGGQGQSADLLWLVIRPEQRLIARTDKEKARV